MSTNLKSAKSKTEEAVQMTSFNGGDRGQMLQFSQHASDDRNGWGRPSTIQADKKQVKKMVKVMAKWLEEQS